MHIQSRIASELSRLSERESAVVASLDSAPPHPSSLEGEDEGGGGGLDRHQVLGEIERLRARLESAPRLRALDDGVTAAREAVRSCLVAQYAPFSSPPFFNYFLWRGGLTGMNSNTRPLDCWKEVEDFKAQARRLEKQFVVRTVGREY